MGEMSAGLWDCLMDHPVKLVTVPVGRIGPLSEACTTVAISRIMVNRMVPHARLVISMAFPPTVLYRP